jgi:hypothetical protein
LVLVGNAVRLALVACLYQVNCEESLASLSDAEQEEWRFVWWIVFKLDCSVNVASVTPFGIDTDTIATALVSTTVENFTAGRAAPSSKFLPNSSQRWILESRGHPCWSYTSTIRRMDSILIFSLLHS